MYMDDYNWFFKGWKIMRIKNGLYDIYITYGKNTEKIKAMEELGELYLALQKEDLENIYEEVADVLNVIEHIKTMYNLNNTKILKIRHNKVKRELDRINARIE